MGGGGGGLLSWWGDGEGENFLGELNFNIKTNVAFTIPLTVHNSYTLGTSLTIVY
jgi:hypothetical protein